MGAVSGLPQSAVFSVGQEREIAGHIQAQQPGSFRACGRGVTGLSSCGRKSVLGSFRQASHLVSFRELQGPLLCGIKNMVAEAGGQGGQALAGRIEGSLGLSIKAHTPVLHRQQFGVENSLTGWRQWLGRLVLQATKGLMQHLALAEPVSKTHNLWLLAGMGVPKFGGIADTVQV